MSETQIRIVDENNTGDVISELKLLVKKPTVTVRDIIQARVENEVSAYNANSGQQRYSLVKPTAAEEILNGKRREFKLKEAKAIDLEAQIEVALSAFEKNGYLVLVDDKQVESLDQQITISKDTKIIFLKLTPLVGG